MINNNREIENAWNMMQYLYDELRSKRLKDLDITRAETLDELYVLIISQWAASLAKEGLYKEYVTYENVEMSSPQGEINIQESISQQTLMRGKLICNYDELSSNVYINKVIKCILQYLITNNNSNKLIKEELKKSIQLYNGIDNIDLYDIHWKQIKLNNSNMRYKHILDMCKSLLQEHKAEKEIGLNDDRRLYILFKKQLVKYIENKYIDDNIIDILDKQYNNDIILFEKYIFNTQKVIVIRNDKRAMLILIKLQNDDNDTRLKREILYEFIEHMRDFKKEYSIKTCGLLLYVNINKNKLNLQPLTSNNVSNFLICETTVDLHDQWRFTLNKIDEAYKYCIGRFK